MGRGGKKASIKLFHNAPRPRFVFFFFFFFPLVSFEMNWTPPGVSTRFQSANALLLLHALNLWIFSSSHLIKHKHDNNQLLDLQFCQAGAAGVEHIHAIGDAIDFYSGTAQKKIQTSTNFSKLNGNQPTSLCEHEREREREREREKRRNRRPTVTTTRIPINPLMAQKTGEQGYYSPTLTSLGLESR